MFVPQFEGQVCSLGYDVIDWIEAYCRHPDLDGNPYIELLKSQCDFIIELMKIDPKTGRRLFRRSTLQESKGKGKAYVSAGLGYAALAGPFQFDGWDASGQPVAAPIQNSRSYIIGVAEDATANIMAATHGIGNVSDEMMAEYRLAIQFGRIRKDGGGIIEPVSTSAGAREGMVVSGVLLADESHHMTEKRHKRTYDTMCRNTLKSGGLVVATTNAYRIGESSVAEEEQEAAGEPGARGLMFWRSGPDAVTYDVKDPDNVDKLREDLELAYGDSSKREGGWVDTDDIIETILYDKKTTAQDAIRFFLNISCVGDSALCDVTAWNDAPKCGALEPSAEIWLGFDGSKSDDSTVLVAVGADLDFHLIKKWQRPETLAEEDVWEVPRDEVRTTIDSMFEQYEVRRMFGDPYMFTEMLDALAEKYGQDRVVKVWSTQTTVITRSIDLFTEMVAGGDFSHEHDDVLTDHVSQAQVEVSGKMKKLIKPKRHVKIDAAVGAVFARAAHQSWMLDMAARRKKKRKTVARGFA